MVSSSTYRGEVTDQLHLYHDAFAGTTASPKIPDGKAESSVGLHMQEIREFQGVNANGVMDLVLFPGLGVCARVDGSQELEGPAAMVDFPNWRDTSRYISPSFVGHGVNHRLTRTNSLAKWRLVSAGLQMKLLNASEEDDGWWEAIRLHTDNDTKEWCMKAIGPGAWDGGSHFCRKMPTGSPGPNEKSYATGLLRDLGKVQFDLKPTYVDHEFITPREELNVIVATSFNNGMVDSAENPGQDADFSFGSSVAHNLFDDATDKSFDQIFIRIHGRPGTGTQTRLHCNFIANYETIYSRESDLSLFETKSHDIGENHMGIHRDANKNPSAAAIIP